MDNNPSFKNSFKAYLLKLVDDSLSTEEKEKRKGKSRNEKQDLATGILKYLRIANAAEE